jgi:hypothetical protein
MNYQNIDPIKITVEGGLVPDRSIQISMNPHATIEEWVETFKVILVHQTFDTEIIKEIFDYNNI